MALTRGGTIGYDTQIMCYRFTMLDEGGQDVPCSISSVALDDLSSNRCVSDERRVDRNAQFLALRDDIEALASMLHDNGVRDRGAIRIFGKHVRAWRKMPSEP